MAYVRDLFIILSIFSLISCGADDSGTPVLDDAGGKALDPTGNPPPNSKLTKCSEPGKACVSHDACAINPVCNEEGFCVAEKLQDCDDGVECTEDICLGAGQCEHRAAAGFCAIANKDETVTCYRADQRDPNDPCMICDPEKKTNRFSPANGGRCDDGDACTQNEYCVDGQCKNGNDYREKCADDLECTEDLCDGQGGCLPKTAKPGTCLIDETCYKDQDTGPAGLCTRCDSQVDSTKWTVLSNACLIDDICREAGEADHTGCAICDPSKDTTAWSGVSTGCQIDGTCYEAGAKNESWCAVCDPTSSTTDWTPLTDKCEIDGVCHDRGEKNLLGGGCAVCNPDIDREGWTLEGDGCLIDGKCYKTGDKDTQDCRSCDPTKSKHAWTLSEGFCFINDACYADLAEHEGKCAVCNSALNATEWTILEGNCLIDDTCRKQGEVDSQGCAVCEPSLGADRWTVSGYQCLIDGKCYNPGAVGPSGCAECNPVESKTNWTAILGCSTLKFVLLDGTFEGNLGGIVGADAACTAQAKAAGVTGTFKAFLSSSTQNARSLMSGPDASQAKMTNLNGEILYENWRDIFSETNPPSCGSQSSPCM